MILKRFSKPNWRRIGIFIMIYIVLISLVMTLGITKRNCEFLIQRGFPFHYFFAKGGACKKNGVIQLIEFETHFSFGSLFLDVFVWGLISYFLSALIIWVFNRIRKKR